MLEIEKDLYSKNLEFFCKKEGNLLGSLDAL